MTLPVAPLHVVIDGVLLGSSLDRKNGYLQLLLDHHKLPSLPQQKAALHSHQHAPWWPISKAVGKLSSNSFV